MTTQVPLGVLNSQNNYRFSQLADIQNCIQQCIHCHMICKQMIHHCLQMGGMYAEPSHVRLLEDCAEVSALTASLMLRESNLYSHLCSVCAIACEECGERCRRFPDDDRMKACAQACEQTAESCHQVMKAHSSRPS